MKNDSKYRRSRRDFIQLAAVTAGASAITGCSALRSDGRPSDTDERSRSKTTVAELVSTAGNLAIREAHQTVNLNGTWSVTALPLDVEGEAGYVTYTRGPGERLAAQVPGEIHLDLMRAGRMEDPNISDNARTRCRWPEKHSWWYRTEFTVPSGFRQNMRQQLVFDGIDLYGQIFVNGKLAATTKNAFATIDIDVKRLLQDGANELVVRVTSGMELVPPSAPGGDAKIDSLYSMRTGDSHEWAFLRKPDYAAYGTDFNDPLPNIGIWRAVRLEGRSKVVIDYVRLDTAIRGQEVSLEGEVILENLHPWSEIPGVLELRVDPPQGSPIVRRFSIGTEVGRCAVTCRIVIPNPQLWWPNGMGEQPLYRLTTRFLCGDEETDWQVQTIGLRTIELDRSPLPDGSRFCFKVNGKDVYCKGGNWAPGDLIAARMDAAQYQKLVEEARNAHFTMFRVNGVGLYESDDFYDACDRAGILVGQDFTFSDAQYPDQDPEFVASVREEAEDAVRRLRHHPSLVLWWGNSECNWCMTLKWKCDPAKSEEIGGVRIYNEVLPDICRFYDPGRPYLPSSPIGGIEANSGTDGDTHGPYGNFFDDDNFTGLGDEDAHLRSAVDNNQRLWQERADEMHTRFVSEYGIIGPPNLASVREYLNPDELSINSIGWKIHTNMFDVGEGSGSAISAGIRYHYGDPKALNLPEYILYGQMYQAQLQGGFVEAMRFRKGDPKADCQGVLLWSYNDTWGEAGWSLVDHYARRKASYYWWRRAAAPVKVLVRSRGGNLVTRVVNDTLRTYQAVVRCGWVRLDGSASEWRKHPVTIPVNGTIEVTSTPFPPPAERSPREWLYAATVTGEGIPQDQAIWLLAPQRELALAKPVISATVNNGMLVVSSPVYAHGVHLEDEGREVLADNYFDLLPATARSIPITPSTPLGTYSLTAIMPID
jgi:beta-mannosidase